MNFLRSASFIMHYQMTVQASVKTMKLLCTVIALVHLHTR